MQPTILFEEKTRPFKIICIVLTVLLIPFLYGVARQLFFDQPLGTKPISDTHLIFFTIGYILFLLLMNSARQKLCITSEGFYLSTPPLTGSDLRKWTAVQEVRIESYSTIREYFGAGFRTRLSGMAYLAGGQPGIKLLMHNGDKLILAAREQERLIQILTDIAVIKNENPYNNSF